MKFLFAFWCSIVVLTGNVCAQAVDPKVQISATSDSSNDRTNGIDIRDVIHQITRRNKPIDVYSANTKNVQFALIPVAGYTLQTGFAAVLAANVVFYTNNEDRSHASNILTSVIYTQYNQLILPLSVNLWTKDRNWNVISDVRYMSYPSQTFGLGPETAFSDGYQIDFSYMKFHQTALRRINNNLFAGVGYYLDQFWKTKEHDPPVPVTSFKSYGLYTRETASGICFQGLWDNRANQINPVQGWYASLRYRVSPEFLGSTESWSSSVIEFRKYFQFPRNSKNVLAFWNYNWLTLSGRPPYLLLPSTGWDDFFNTGRGYIQGRYRDKNMSYLETEYRFGLTKNGLLGGVVFANLQTFSHPIEMMYHKVMPGGGAGLRIKVNKHSSTNLAIDYAFGTEGSRGFFINLGEVF